MRNIKKKKIIAVCEKCGWNVTVDGDFVTLELEDTPFSFECNISEIQETARAEYWDFDENEFIEMWMEAKRNGCRNVPTVRGLLEAADAINDSLEKLGWCDFKNALVA